MLYCVLFCLVRFGSVYFLSHSATVHFVIHPQGIGVECASKYNYTNIYGVNASVLSLGHLPITAQQVMIAFAAGTYTHTYVGICS